MPLFRKKKKKEEEKKQEAVAERTGAQQQAGKHPPLQQQRPPSQRKIQQQRPAQQQQQPPPPVQLKQPPNTPQNNSHVVMDPAPPPAQHDLTVEPLEPPKASLKTPPPHPKMESSKSDMSASSAIMSDLEEQNQRNNVTRELVKKFVADIWNRGELELIPEVCSKSLRFNGSVGMDRVGHDGFARMVTTIRDALIDYHCEIHSMVVEGGKAFCRMRFTGRHTGSLLGYAPTGRQVAWMGAAEFTCKGGKIIKVWELGDVKSLEEQLSGS